MIKLNKTTEYGLMALRHMSRKRINAAGGVTEVTSAREVSDTYQLPFEITAKTLQRLKDTGLIQSAQGAKGGYILQKELGDVSLAQFLELMEGPQSVVACGSESRTSSKSCDYQARCEIKHLMSDLNHRVHDFLSSIRLAELSEGDPLFTPSHQDMPANMVGGEP